MSVFNLAGPVYSQSAVKATQEAPQEPTVVADEEVVVEEVKEPVKAPKTPKTKKNKED